ncbi:MAG: Fur family transcriptional regulator [Thermodesulfobacteriota bacterium]
MNFKNDFHLSIKNLPQLLHQKGLKYTRQREIVWSAFCALEGHHPSAEAVYHQAKMVSPRISWATVYRTLKLMKSLGIIVERDFSKGAICYELKDKGLMHGHFICSSCGKVIELKNGGIKNYLIKKAQRHKFKIMQERIEGIGLCSRCWKKLNKI